MYISVLEASKKFNISQRRVQTYCEQGRIEGAYMISGVWAIPDDAQKPCDARSNHNKYVQTSLFKNNDELLDEKLNIKQVCDIFSVSEATIRNWVRLGKLDSECDGKIFDKKYIENVVAKIKNGSDQRLKSRRNKKSVTGSELYKDYAKNEVNLRNVNEIINSSDSLNDSEIRVIIAHFATQLYEQSNKSVKINNNWISERNEPSNDEEFNSLISNLLSPVDLLTLDITHIQDVFNYKFELEPTEDTLGLIYISLRDLSRRKQTGAYYTPLNVVNLLIKSLLECKDLSEDTILDPCCGTGNFLIGLVNSGIKPVNLYGSDIDEISVFITRINMFLLNQNIGREVLETHFLVENTLEKRSDNNYTIVLGNPPWGYDYNQEETSKLLNNYYTAKKKGMESYDLFIEKGLQLVKNNGYLAYVLPESILNVKSHIQAREVLIKNSDFKFIKYLDNAFSGVQCPSIILGTRKGGTGKTKGCNVSFGKENFVIKNDRAFKEELFPFNMSDDEYECLNAISTIDNAKYLRNNATFALGIVTGNNKEYIKGTYEEGYEPILKGSNISKYSIDNDKKTSFIKYQPELFQQVAPTEIYRAKEKLLYRFISEVPVFAYDNAQTLSLNSCNILIPEIDGLDIKYILAILNSSVASFFMNKKYNSIKLLRTHIESLPIPMVSEEIQEKIIKKVDHMINSKENISGLYEDLDKDVMKLYSLSDDQIKTINVALEGKNKFI